jgi:hypothetical protein
MPEEALGTLQGPLMAGTTRAAMTVCRPVRDSLGGAFGRAIQTQRPRRFSHGPYVDASAIPLDRNEGGSKTADEASSRS